MEHDCVDALNLTKWTGGGGRVIDNLLDHDISKSHLCRIYLYMYTHCKTIQEKSKGLNTWHNCSLISLDIIIKLHTICFTCMGKCRLNRYVKFCWLHDHWCKLKQYVPPSQGKGGGLISQFSNTLFIGSFLTVKTEIKEQYIERFIEKWNQEKHFKMSGRPPQYTTNEGSEHYDASSKWNKEILITRDPVFVNKAVIDGRYIGRKPHNYLPLAVLVCIINPIMGPLGILFSGRYMLKCMQLIFISSVYIYFAI